MNPLGLIYFIFGTYSLCPTPILGGFNNGIMLLPIRQDFFEPMVGRFPYTIGGPMMPSLKIYV